MRKGYTLVELLVTLLLLGLLGGVIIFNVNNLSNKSKKSEYKRYIETILSAAKVYSNVNTVAFSELYDNKAFIYIELNDLVNEGLLDENLKNPYTKEKINLKDQVKANLDSTGVLTFTYPIKSEEKEVFLVTQDDYVENGEVFDCMYGLNTYELTLANEDGTYVNMTQENINKYNFKCEIPEKLVSSNYELAGKYDIKYTWLTESGTKKSGVRKLNVLPKAVPDFEVKDSKNKKYTYNKNDDVIYLKPTTTDCNEFNKLKILPILNGAPTNSVEFNIEKRHDDSNPWTSVSYTGDYINVDDGVTEYKVSTSVKGHHNTSYTYSIDKTIKIEQDISISSCGLENENDTYDLSKIYTISKNAISTDDTNTNYEWKIISSTSDISDDIEVDNSYLTNEFVDNKLKINASSEDTMCIKAINNFDKLYVRAITSDGYVSSWSELVSSNLKITNDLYKIIESAECNIAGDDINELTSSLGEIKCFYNSKTKYVKYGNNKYVVLGLKNSDGVIAILDNTILPDTVLTEENTNTWSSNSIDTEYTYNTPKIDNLYDALNTFESTLPDNHEEALYNTIWDYKVGEYAFNVPSINDDFNTWKSYYRELNGNEYHESYVGILTSGEVRIFNNSLLSDNSFFVGTTYLNSREITNINHESTNINDTLFLQFKEGEIVKEDTLTSSIKPVIVFKNINICSGTGTDDDPYIITTSNS